MIGINGADDGRAAENGGPRGLDPPYGNKGSSLVVDVLLLAAAPHRQSAVGNVLRWRRVCGRQSVPPACAKRPRCCRRTLPLPLPRREGSFLRECGGHAYPEAGFGGGGDRIEWRVVRLP